MVIRPQRALRLVDLRVAAVMVSVASTPLAPTWALRQGAAIAGIALLLSLSSYRPVAADWWFFLYTMWVVASAEWSRAPEATSLAIKNQLACLVIFAAIRATTKSVRHVVAFVAAYSIGCMAAVFDVYRQNPDFRVSWRFDNSAERLGLMGLNQNYTAYALATGIALLVVVFPWCRSRSTRLLVLATSAIIYLGAVQQGTRGATVAVVLVLVWAVVRRWVTPVVTATTVALLGVIAVSLSTGLIDGAIRSHLAVSAREQGDLNGRLPTWRMARSLIEDHPLNGVGAGAFRVVSPYGIGAHNAFLEVAAGVGLIGLAAFVATLYFCLRRWQDGSTRERRSTMPLILVLAPILLSGHWSESPAAWTSIALASTLLVGATSTQRSPDSPGAPLGLMTEAHVTPGGRAQPQAPAGMRTRAGRASVARGSSR